MAFEKQLIAAMNNPQAAAAWRECQELDEAYDSLLETAESYLNDVRDASEKSELLEAERDALAGFAETAQFTISHLTYALADAEGDLALGRKIFALLGAVSAIFFWGAIMGALR